MTTKISLTHRTIYHYDRLTDLSPQIVRLRPAPHARTPVCSYSLKVEPHPHFINWLQDPHGNYLARLVFPEKVKELSIEVDLVVEMAVFNPFDFFIEPEAENFPFAYAPALAEELSPFLRIENPGPQLSDFLDRLDRFPCNVVDFLVKLNCLLQQTIAYVVRLEPGVQSCEETLCLGTGSCRDSAWLLVQVLRNLGLAARFVSGYLIQLKPDQKAIDGPSGPTEDFTDLHAWTEVYIPGAGWIGLDPTSGLLAGEGHIPLACSPDHINAAPISGGVGICSVTFSHHMEIKRIFETARVTKPYDEEQWQAINQLGDQIDALLEKGDVRLTMGGEPTFISIDDMEGDEWNTAAVGPAKRKMAYDLIMRLRQRFAPNGLLTFGQGKWYPGESLPRWAFALYWRSDQHALWRDEKLIANEADSHPLEENIIRRFGKKLAERLEISPEFLIDAYEDPVHFSQIEQKLPLNSDISCLHVEDHEERARLIRVLTNGLSRPVGFVLPIQSWNAKDGRRWLSGYWPLRQDRLYLLPGDSPIGFRLPLDSLPFLPESERQGHFPEDPFAPRQPLSDVSRRRQMARQRYRPPAPTMQQEQHLRQASSTIQEDHNGLFSTNVRTALCLHPRDGRLCIFLPPTENVEDFVDLVSAIEDVAAELLVPVHIEGYGPPADSRINVIKVTPDPGVIEVNIHPAHNWQELRNNLTFLYEEARQTRLGAEKFMIDGRHVGTGGGNHIVVGGATASDSPFLRRPDLLGSLLRCWQNFPALSYLFSGLFIGPTSQAPRVDEARDDSLYELELALSQLPEVDSEAPPWLVDRVLRNVLIDVTGNTHRTEICIDKLYSPDGPTGRLGLVEFRGFEMPPHPQMNCLQHLLLRALIARFWYKPYKAPLIHWKNALRDRFMLPHFIWQNFCTLLEELHQDGFVFEESWFMPHFEFRFPLYGSVNHGSVSVELRQALEPWHVMGEESGGGGTVRFVDSSLERLQVKVSGLFGDRLVVTCNKRQLPLVATGIDGEYVAGVRFRAWQPVSCLHPGIGVQTPLIFDVMDGWSGRSLGGCSYHVAHPGGINYETFPVNGNEAESRRVSRFFPFGHHIGQINLTEEKTNPHFPTTLDLRLKPNQ